MRVPAFERIKILFILMDIYQCSYGKNENSGSIFL